MKRLFISFIFSIFIFFLSALPTQASNYETNVYFFWGDGCPHCAKEQEVINYYSHKYEKLHVYQYEMYKNFNNAKLLQDIGDTLGINISGVPISIIGNKEFIGFADTITPQQLEDRIEYCLHNGCLDSVAPIVGVTLPMSKPKPTTQPINEGVISTTSNNKEGKSDANNHVIENNVISNNLTDEININDNVQKIVSNTQETALDKNVSPLTLDEQNNFNLPIIGDVNAQTVSLPFVTILLGILDGFNPCAMWVLLFLISLLLGMEDRKRMWILGSAFIISSSTVYFVFMSAWLNLILFLGFIIWIRIAIGLIALLGGGHNIKEFFFNKDSGCHVVGEERRQKIFGKLKEIIGQHSFWLALGGIILLAGAVNMVELICSAGLPAIYTQILALNNLTTVQYYLYILLYILFFMLDDLVIFFAAMVTLKMTGVTTKYSRWSRLIGGVLMLAIGILLIFKPEWLMFG